MKYLVATLVILIMFSCNHHKINYNDLVMKSIKINKLKTPLIIHKTNNNEKLKSNNFFKLLSTKKLLLEKDESFYSLFILEESDKIQVVLVNYKSGIDYCTTFDNKSYKVLKNEYLQTKRGESKPYYLYWSIMKAKYPKYMNWDTFEIPTDSLK
ncbi:hypothetical protein [Flavobacterium terrigena]|uniref:Lipoprotein n=1 Tax=Flavobacterium terrigena TaxID=402734 RepID=A0A1H6V858_9FLAO|nr:hypothetical protein [Flavobacterium terrigena]SEJ00773.1 hypothetical protein SAMN05660918_2132 [Flavobacterium terrigena]